MAADAIVVLQTLHCVKERDESGHSEPYIWPALLWVDDLTLHTPPGVGIAAPALGNARVVIKSGMKSGQTADIPLSVSTMRVRFDKPDMTPLFLVVALWENDDTPQAALQAGYSEFVVALPAEIGAQLLPLKAARDAHDDEALRAIIAIIKAHVISRVRSAIENALTGPQKAQIFLGLLNLDDIIEGSFQVFETAASAPVALVFRLGSTDFYAIKGRLEVRPVVIDRCQAEVNAVKSAQAAVDEIDQQISSLEEDRDHAPGPEKHFFQEQIDELEDVDRPIALDALGVAQQKLAACRARRPPVVVGTGGTVTFPT